MLGAALSEARERSRSPRGSYAGATSNSVATNGSLSSALTTSTGFDFPSSKLGQLLGFKGLTIQKIKEISGVTRLHIHDKEKAKYQDSIPIEVAGSPEQVDHCKRVLESLIAGDQTELGHLTTYVNIEPSVVGKCMGYKGTTVKQMTEVTGCYIEIQQDRSRGNADTPRLFVAGQPDAVDSAVQLINRFIASPGSKLDAVLGPGAGTESQPALPSSVSNDAASALQPLLNALASASGNPQLANPAYLQSCLNTSSDGALSAFEPDGPKVERIIEVPARKKGHLLGLHGQTIEKIRQTSGVIKCHIMADKGYMDKQGNIQVQIFGTKERVDICADLVQRVVSGDHSGIGHASDTVWVDPAKVNRLRGDHWQVINTLKDLTGTYLDIIQGPQAGLLAGEAQLFMAGPAECVDRAKTIVNTLLNMMDHVPATGEISSEALGSVLGSLGPQSEAPPAQTFGSSRPSGHSGYKSGSSHFGGSGPSHSERSGHSHSIGSVHQAPTPSQSNSGIQGLLDSLVKTAQTLIQGASQDTASSALQSIIGSLTQTLQNLDGATNQHQQQSNSWQAPATQPRQHGHNRQHPAGQHGHHGHHGQHASHTTNASHTPHAQHGHHGQHGQHGTQGQQGQHNQYLENLAASRGLQAGGASSIDQLAAAAQAAAASVLAGQGAQAQPSDSWSEHEATPADHSWSDFGAPQDTNGTEYGGYGDYGSFGEQYDDQGWQQQHMQGLESWNGTEGGTSSDYGTADSWGTGQHQY